MGFGCDAVGTSSLNLPTSSKIIEPNKKIEDISSQHFKIIKKLGEGSYGKVYLIRSKETQKEYSLKKINFNPKKYDKVFSFMDEVNILKKIDHPNIISFKGAFIDKNKKLLNMITEYADNGDLGQLLNQNQENKEYFEESQLLDWLIQCSSALQYLHEKEIMHRDIKPSNILLMINKTIKLGDFGISKDISMFHITKTLKGSPLYMAPEIYKNLKYDCKVDIWSLGVTFCHLMTLEFPFEIQQDKDKMYENIIKGNKNKKILNLEGNNYNENILKNYSKEFLDLIDEMMTVDPEKRPLIYDILQRDIITKRIDSTLRENKFNDKDANHEIEDYEKNEEIRLKKLEEKFNKTKQDINMLFIEDINDDDVIEEEPNEKKIISSLKVKELKYNLLRQMSLIHKERTKNNRLFMNYV